MKLLLAILAGRIISHLARMLKIGGGSSAPGLYALKIDPDIVEKLVQRIPKNVVITGTNGKTTTARMIAHFAKENNLKVIRNHTGSNLERGIASTLINSYSHMSGGNVDLGIWELDEAAFNTVAPKLKPDIVVFLNVFRDQLDRYGEVDSVVKKWCQSLKNLPKETVVLVNRDDVNTSKLAKCFSGKVQKFGVKDYKIVGESIEYLKEKEDLDFEAKNVKISKLNGSTFYLSTKSDDRQKLSRIQVRLPVPGIYHIYDAVGAMACAMHLGLSLAKIVHALKDFRPAFGRVERLDFGYILLIKNPAGATQVFETIAPTIKKNDRLLFALNDNLADGTDVSWIWDADFEALQSTHYNLPTFCSGTRAYDLANRLKYAGFPLDISNVEPDLKKALKKAREGLKGRLFILPTYTAMLELQKILAQSGVKKNYWQEEL